MGSGLTSWVFKGVKSLQSMTNLYSYIKDVFLIETYQIFALFNANTKQIVVLLSELRKRYSIVNLLLFLISFGYEG